MEREDKPSLSGNALRIVPAKLSESEIIIDILEERARWLVERGITGQWEVGEFAQSVYRKRLARRIAHNEVYLAWHTNIAVGTMAILPAGVFDQELWAKITSPLSSEDALYVHSLAVRQTYAGQNIGHIMLEEGKRIARKARKHALRLDCWADNVALCNYYKQAGFSLMGIVGGEWRGACWETAV